MSVAHRLGKDESEIEGWSLKRLTRWMAYFKIVQEEEERAIERARSPFKGKKPPGMSV
jgi:hypothetical protein